MLLQQYSRQEEVVIGTPYANRDQAEVHDLIGCFVKWVPTPAKTMLSCMLTNWQSEEGQ